MGARELILNLRNSGFVIAAGESTIKIAPAEKLSSDLTETIRRSKPEILAELQREKLETLVRLCARHYQFSEAELTEALALAFADPEAALEAYSRVAKTVMREQQEALPKPATTHQYKGLECGNCSNLSMTKHTPEARRLFQWTCKAGFKPLVIGYGLERVLVAPEECDCYAGAKLH